MQIGSIDVNKFIAENAILDDKVDHRQKFHIMAPVGLINDPNGFCKFKGKYYLFYQTHPFKAYHGVKYWAKLTSENLVNWEFNGIVIKPEFWFEKDGCFSGNAFVENDKMYLFYTGNLWKDGREFEVGEEYQCLAVSEDGDKFEKLSEPIIGLPDFSEFTPHLRDPRVWKHEDKYYMIIGAQKINEKPAIMLYSSEDLVKWNQEGILLDSTHGEHSKGYMWECPGYAKINGKDILFICPQGMTYEGNITKNRHQSGYLIGNIDYEKCIYHYDYHNYNLLDYGFEFYSPQIFTEDNGRHLCIAWMGLPYEDDHPTVKDNWIHCLTLPTELIMKNEKLYRRPIKELELLRGKHIPIDLTISNSFKADCFELLMEFDSNCDVNIDLRCSENMDSLTHLYYDSHSNTIGLKRINQRHLYDGSRTIKLSDAKDKRKLHVFVDISSIEIFINDGEYALTTRIFTDKHDIYNNISTNGNLTLLKCWELG